MSLPLTRDASFHKQGSGSFLCQLCAEDYGINEEDVVWYVSGEVKLACSSCGATNEVVLDEGTRVRVDGREAFVIEGPWGAYPDNHPTYILRRGDVEFEVDANELEVLS